MSWHSVTITASEFDALRRDLRSIYRPEIDAGRVSGYILFASGKDRGNRLIFISPAAAVLFERAPIWKKRLKPFKGTPRLKGFRPVPVESAT